MDPHLHRRNPIFTSFSGGGGVPPTIKHSNDPQRQRSASLPVAAAAYTCSRSSESCPSVDFKSLLINPLEYTSLKDILPSVKIRPDTDAVDSPRQYSSSRDGGGGNGLFASVYCMRKPFVKQGIWGSYLRPKSAAEDSGDGHQVVHFWVRISGCLQSMMQILTRTLDRVLGAIKFWR